MMKYVSLVSAVAVLIAFGVTADVVGATRWDMDVLSVAPQVWADPNRSVEGVEAIFYEGLAWKGERTRVFAYYGCGFLGDNSTWLGTFENMGKAKAQKWLGLWDPSQYLAEAPMPMLWVTGTNDFAYPMDSLQKSYRLPVSARTLCVRVRMPHAHGGPGENPEEIRAMADAVLKSKTPLARITDQGRQGARAWVAYESQTPVSRGELNYTTDSGKWQDRNWQTIEATLDTQKGKASATLPDEVTVYYFNLIDGRNLVVSSAHEELVAN